MPIPKDPVRTPSGFRNQTTGGGASFGMFNPLVAPESPDSRDIETWTDLPTDWAVWAPGGGALGQSRSVYEGALVLDTANFPAGSGEACTGIYRPLPTETEWSAYTRLSLIGPRTASGAFIECGFGVAEDLAGAPDTSWLEIASVFREDANDSLSNIRSTALANYATSTVPNSGSPGAVEFPGSWWFRIRKPSAVTTTQYAADYSTDGIRWQQLHIGASFGVPATPAHLVVLARATASGANPCPPFRVVVGPTRFATGPTSNDITSLIPAGPSGA